MQTQTNQAHSTPIKPNPQSPHLSIREITCTQIGNVNDSGHRDLIESNKPGCVTFTANYHHEQEQLGISHIDHFEDTKPGGVMFTANYHHEQEQLGISHIDHFEDTKPGCVMFTANYHHEQEQLGII